MVGSKPVNALKAMTVSIDSIQPHPESPRSGDIALIASSLATHGQFRPLTVNTRDNRILKGNNTYAAAKKLGWKKIAVVMVDVDDQHARRILIADNRAADLATYNVHTLLETFSQIGSVEGTGFELEDLKALSEDQPTEETKEPPKEVGMGGRQAASSFVKVKVGSYQWGVDAEVLDSWEAQVMVEAEDVKAQAIRIVRNRLGIPDEPVKKRRSKTENATGAILDVDNVDMATLVPWEPNPREGDVGFITESLTVNGQYTPLIVQKSTNRIIIGNHTFKAAQWLGWTEISIAYIEVDDEQAAKIMLMDNRASDVSDYDGEILKKTLLTLDSWEGTGFSDEDVDEIFRGYSTKPSSRRRKNVRASMQNIKFAIDRDIFFAWSDSLPTEKTEQVLAERLGFPESGCEFDV